MKAMQSLITHSRASCGYRRENDRGRGDDQLYGQHGIIQHTAQSLHGVDCLVSD